MSLPHPRLNRLPHRLDYTLIPAPLNLSVPLVPEKSPVPAIIVTPSSPSSSHEFSIAFVPVEKHSLRERISSFAAPLQLKTRARTTFLLALLTFVLVCHVITYRLAASYSDLDEGDNAGGFMEWFLGAILGNGHQKGEFSIEREG